jgi:G3E family GTPase
LNICAFLTDTLALWRVAGRVGGAAGPHVAKIHANGITLAIERAPEGMPFRWLVHSSYELRPRACTSIIGLLNTLRDALGVERGNAVQVVRASTSPRYAQHERSADSVRPERSGSEVEGRTDSVIPITVITGFLGSGKTTLLAHLLRQPEMRRTAVIMNELGAVGLDHDLIETSDESFVQLSNGCLCCRVRSDLVLTLGDLAARRSAGTVPPFERVVIETTGLADPAPILHALMSDRDVPEIFSLDAVVTTVDALCGLATLDAHEEARRQAAVADMLLITKTDISDAHAEALTERVRAMNPDAPIVPIAGGAIELGALFGARTRSRAPLDRPGGLERTFAEPLMPFAHARDRNDIGSCCIVRDEPLHAATLPLLVEALARNCGADLIRMKGLVNVAGIDSPAVMHGVQHVYHAPEWLERWPSGDRRTRLVFIGRNIGERWARTLLETIDAEVVDETGKRALHA